MLIVIDGRMPGAAKNSLRLYGEVLELATDGITYAAISGHPDIFICQTPGGLILAPNSPPEFMVFLQERNILFSTGQFPVGPKYPDSARYNAVCTQKYLIHYSAITDPAILSCNPGLEQLSVPQGYTRCSLLALNEDHFITSDKGIEKALREKGLNSLYVSPVGIVLPGVKHGFFGGCCGLMGRTLFICGSLKFVEEADEIRAFVATAGYSITELYNGPLWDGGGILFVNGT